MSSTKTSFKACVYLVCFSFLIFLYGFFYFYHKITDCTLFTSNVHQVDAVVVVTGSADRIKQGFRLASKYKAKFLLISGVNSIVEKSYYASYCNKYNLDERAVILGYIATNTNYNAIETQMFMILNNLQSLLLITTSMHMPRTYFIFKNQMPDYQIIPYPIISKHKENFSFIVTTFIVTTFIEYSKYMIELGSYQWHLLYNMVDKYHELLLDYKSMIMNKG